MARIRRLFLTLTVAAVLATPAQAATLTQLKAREHRQQMTLHANQGTIRFFRHHRWLTRGHTRPIAMREIRRAQVWVAVVRRELAETRAALRPKPAAMVDGCLHELIDRESHWNVSASNPSTGAYGLPQALPGRKMASAGADWATNPATQIRWMLGYVRKYGGSCGALAFQKRNGWY